MTMWSPLRALAAHAAPYSDPAVVGVTGPAPGPPLIGRAELGETMWRAIMERRHMCFDLDFPFVAQWAVGFNMSFRRQVIVDVGGFDENFIGPVGENAEDRIQYTPHARLVHFKARSGRNREEREIHTTCGRPRSA